ncbi:aspartate kinase [Verrucomicrobium spinosum]|uniref:aspartate kinase n=1 Tax=Verrucomicrobium spinosum TaxID=2736 RepID=UPI000A884A7E|nr:aspartate kinase [Verrucomicrobium spinosum]
MLLSTGEQQTIALTAMAINAQGGKAVSLTGAQAGIQTDGVHTKARIANITPTEVHEMLDEGNIVILAGFQGQTRDGLITTLGRGGSDLTAIAMAAAVKADLCQIYTDVDGVYTCDPRVVPTAQKIDVISYDEMLEMASSGSKVMQSRSVEFAKKFGVRFEVRNSMNNNPGTLVKEEEPGMESVVVRGVSLERNQAKITIDDVPDRPGVAAKIFGAIHKAGVVIDMIVQNVSWDNETDISFTLSAADLPKAEAALQAVLAELGDKVELRSQTGVAKLSIVGIGMRSHSGVASKMFGALANAGINIQMISTSEIKTAVTVEEGEIEKAAKVVHEPSAWMAQRRRPDWANDHRSFERAGLAEVRPFLCLRRSPTIPVGASGSEASQADAIWESPTHSTPDDEVGFRSATGNHRFGESCVSPAPMKVKRRWGSRK